MMKVVFSHCKCKKYLKGYKIAIHLQKTLVAGNIPPTVSM